MRAAAVLSLCLQLIFFAALIVAGWLAARGSLPADRRHWAALAGFTLGSGLFFFLALFTLLLAAKVEWVQPATFALPCTLTLAISSRLAMRSWSPVTRAEGIALSVSVGGTALALVAWRIWPVASIWHDAIELIGVGEILAANQIFDGHELVSGRPLYYGVFHAMSSRLGMSYFWGLPVTVSVNACVFFIAAANEATMRLGLTQKKRVLLIASCVAFALSSDMMRGQIVLHHVHFITANALMLFSTLALFALWDSQESGAILAVSCAAPLGFMRVEGCIMLLLQVFLLLVYLRPSPRAFRAILTIAGLSVAAVGFLVYTLLPPEAGTLNTHFLFGVLGTGTIFAAAAPRRLVVWLFHDNGPRLASAILLVGGVCVLAGAVLDGEKMWPSLFAVAMNFVKWGLWGSIWWVIFLVAAFISALNRRSFKGARWMADSVLFYFLATIVVGYVRDGSYRIGAMDSANRMSFHIIPTTLLLILCWVAWIGRDDTTRHDLESSQ